MAAWLPYSRSHAQRRSGPLQRLMLELGLPRHGGGERMVASRPALVALRAGAEMPVIDRWRGHQSLTSRHLGEHGVRIAVFGGSGRIGSRIVADRGALPDKAAPEIKGQRDALAYYQGVQEVCWTYVSPPGPRRSQPSPIAHQVVRW